MTNTFIDSLYEKDTTTANGAVSNSTSKNPILDYFFQCGNNRGRDYKEVAADMAKIFSEDPELAMKTVLYNRMITRKEKSTVAVQKGQGQKDEFAKSLIWLSKNRPELIAENISLIPRVGTWSDLWYDSPVTGVYNYIDVDIVYPLIAAAIAEEESAALIAKFIPKIYSKSKATNARRKRRNKWARGLCKYMGWSEAQYRKFKSNPKNKAHEFQRLMCKNKFSELNFDHIPGKALFNMIKAGNILKKHSIESMYIDWISSKPIAKFTGFVYELYKAAKNGGRTLAQKYTYDKQFDGLIEMAKQDDLGGLKGNVFCALDTSGSMMVQAAPGLSALDICISLGIYFSSLNEGSFKDHVVMFDNTSKMLKLKGSFCEKIDQIANKAIAWGSTNFQSVIDLIVKKRKNKPNIPISDYPETLLIVSDMQFNPTVNEKTNYEEAKAKLEAVGLPMVKIIWWNVNSRYGEDVPSQISDEGTTLISGFDPAIITLLLGGEQTVKENGKTRQLTPDEQMVKALDQELLNRIKT